MKFRPQFIAGCFVVELEPHQDERGFFARAHSRDEFEAAGLEGKVSQINLSMSHATGTVRGIHWQDPPFAEAKLIRCIGGRIFDVCVDVRAGSPTEGEWVGVELTPDNGLALYVPPRCGHALQTLEPQSIVLYSVSSPYHPESERGARWDDPAFGIEWPLRTDVVLSEKDRRWPTFKRT